MRYLMKQFSDNNLCAKRQFKQLIVGICSVLLLLNSYATVLADTLPSVAKTPRPLIKQQLYGFDGQLQDPESGLQFLGTGYHRAYNPVTRRFMSQDTLSPFGKGGFNGYLFASNNPIMHQDPSGHFSMSVGSWVSMVLAFIGSAVIGALTGGVAAPEVAANDVAIVDGLIVTAETTASSAVATTASNMGANTINSLATTVVGEQIDKASGHQATMVQTSINFSMAVGMSVIGDVLGIIGGKLFNGAISGMKKKLIDDFMSFENEDFSTIDDVVDEITSSAPKTETGLMRVSQYYNRRAMGFGNYKLTHSFMTFEFDSPLKTGELDEARYIFTAEHAYPKNKYAVWLPSEFMKRVKKFPRIGLKRQTTIDWQTLITRLREKDNTPYSLFNYNCHHYCASFFDALIANG